MEAIDDRDRRHGPARGRVLGHHPGRPHVLVEGVLLKALGVAVLLIGWTVLLVGGINLVHDWMQKRFEGDPEKEEQMHRIYIGGIRRFQ